mmetsp:Transcript_32727/g.101203  ORF Transcript_32727/g.101203 Transcript_32727/m.101203 type:complete len:301 (+) Transcript_32727:1989-2891(+)
MHNDVDSDRRFGDGMVDRATAENGVMQLARNAADDGSFRQGPFDMERRDWRKEKGQLATPRRRKHDKFGEPLPQHRSAPHDLLEIRIDEIRRVADSPGAINERFGRRRAMPRVAIGGFQRHEHLEPSLGPGSVVDTDVHGDMGDNAQLVCLDDRWLPYECRRVESQQRLRLGELPRSSRTRWRRGGCRRRRHRLSWRRGRRRCRTGGRSQRCHVRCHRWRGRRCQRTLRCSCCRRRRVFAHGEVGQCADARGALCGWIMQCVVTTVAPFAGKACLALAHAFDCHGTETRRCRSARVAIVS